MRYSRETIAVCDSAPPVSHTQPAICENAGVQFGVVNTHTKISSGSTSPKKSDDVMTRARPRTTPEDAGTPDELGGGEVRRADRIEQALVDAEDLLHHRVVGLGARGAEHAGISARRAAPSS